MSAGRAPLHPVLPAIAISIGWGLAAVAWLVVGDRLPGGRWLAVHLFTLGMLTNLVAALTHHFAQTLLHAPGGGAGRARLVLLNVGALLVVVGFPIRMPAVFAAGASAALAGVTWLYADLRRMRRAAIGARFAFIVRTYERASGAFIHAALLGLLMGIGVLPGAWHAGARLGHLHLALLGWGGLTLLATMVFFGPTVARRRIADGAEAAAAAGLRRGATGLTIAAFALLLTGAGDPVAVPARLAAAAGLAVYATAVAAVCVPFFKVARAGARSASALMLAGASAWLLAAVAADVVVVATGRFRLLDALGAVLLTGVLAQSILGSLGYLAPMICLRGPKARTAAWRRLDALAVPRAAALNAGVVLIAGAAVAGRGAGALAAMTGRVGWSLIAASALVEFALLWAACFRRRA